MTPEEREATILRLADTGERVDTIAAAVGRKVGSVYAVLREKRPERERTKPGQTSQRAAQIRALKALGTKPARIAALLGVSRAYVYRCLP